MRSMKNEQKLARKAPAMDLENADLVQEISFFVVPKLPFILSFKAAHQKLDAYCTSERLCKIRKDGSEVQEN